MIRGTIDKLLDKWLTRQGRAGNLFETAEELKATERDETERALEWVRCPCGGIDTHDPDWRDDEGRQRHWYYQLGKWSDEVD